MSSIMIPRLHSKWDKPEDEHKDPLVTVRMRRQVYRWLDDWLHGHAVSISWETAQEAREALQHSIGSWELDTGGDDGPAVSLENQFYFFTHRVEGLTRLLKELAIGENNRREWSGIELLTEGAAGATGAEAAQETSEEPAAAACPEAHEPLPALDDYTTLALADVIHYAGQIWMEADADDKIGVFIQKTDDVRLESIWAYEVERELVRVFRRLYADYPAPHGPAAEVIYPNVEMASAAYEAWHAAHVHTPEAHGPRRG